MCRADHMPGIEALLYHLLDQGYLFSFLYSLVFLICEMEKNKTHLPGLLWELSGLKHEEGPDTKSVFNKYKFLSLALDCIFSLWSQNGCFKDSSWSKEGSLLKVRSSTHRG
jgi:hypothetical protein